MKIVFDGQAFVHQVTGGVSRYFAILVAGLDATPGCSARVLSPLHRNEHLSEKSWRLVHGLGLPGAYRVGRICWFATRAMSPALSHLLSADIVHETYFAPKPYMTKARRRVTTMYDMIHEIFTPGHFTTEHKRASVARCDHVLCISHSTKKDLCEIFNLPAERASVTHLGHQDFSTAIGRPRPAALQGAPYVLYVGQRGGYKNFDAALQAFAASASLKREHRIVCFGGGLLTPAERARAAELGLDAHHLTQTGGTDATLGLAYANAMAFVYPSLYEGFGLPPLEAMSAGCPVLASNTSSLPEVVGDAALSFDPKQVDAIRDGLERIAQSAGLRRDLIQRGHERRKLFTWEQCVQQTLDVYRKIS